MVDEAEAGQETILVVDDDEAVLRSMQHALREGGFARTLLCADARDVPELVVQQPPGVVLLDLAMPHLSGESLLNTLLAQVPDLPVIVVTATDDVDTAVRCVKAGAFDFMVKPVDFNRLVTAVTRAVRDHALRAENRELRRRITSPAVEHPEHFAGIVTRSPTMQALFAYIEAIARSPEPVMIVGETGVGKELVAEALHRCSGRPGAFVAVNAAGLDETTFADTLFGHTRGAFTGAAQPRAGLVERAAGGTLFLDEIGDLQAANQTKLLRLIQEREYLSLGADSVRRADCRVLAATNRDLRAGMRNGRFRDDLYYRLGAHLVRVPPLRERIADLPLLVEDFLAEAAQSMGKRTPTPPPALFTYLADYAFPGNVRELRSMVMDAVSQHQRGVLSLQSFIRHMDRSTAADSAAAGTGAPERAGAGARLAFGSPLPTLKETSIALFREALRRAEGNQSAAAQILGVSRRTVSRYASTGRVTAPAGENEDEECGTNP